MEILPIYTKKQMERCLKAGLDPTMIYLLDTKKGKKILEEQWQSVNIDMLGSLKGLIPFLKEVEETKLLIEPRLYDYEKEIKEEVEKYPSSEIITEIVSRAIESPSWRERATLMYLITRMYGGSIEIYKDVATAVELVQEAFMLQDDVLDEQERCVNRETIPHTYGIARANLAKDLILAKAGDILRKSLEGKIMEEGLGLVEEMIKNDTLGQWIDIESEKRQEMSEEEYYQMISLTPGTQFQNILHLAYILTGKKNKEEVDALRNFGLYFGMAAQLRDDIIDVIGDEGVVYKKLGTDVLRGKKRLPLIKYLEEFPEKKKLFGNGKIPQEEANKILEDMKSGKSNSIPYCVQKVKWLINNAIRYLEKIKDCEEKEILIKTAKLVSNFEN